MLGIRCDRVGCDNEIWGMAFDAKPDTWSVVDLGNGDHMDYCPVHAPPIPNV